MFILGCVPQKLEINNTKNVSASNAPRLFEILSSDLKVGTGEPWVIRRSEVRFNKNALDYDKIIIPLFNITHEARRVPSSTPKSPQFPQSSEWVGIIQNPVLPEYPASVVIVFNEPNRDSVQASIDLLIGIDPHNYRIQCISAQNCTIEQIDNTKFPQD